MTVFHVAKNTNYTVMSNHHLRNRELSLKVKGLLSQMLSLPEKWDYTLSDPQKPYRCEAGVRFLRVSQEGRRSSCVTAQFTVYQKPGTGAPECRPPALAFCVILYAVRSPFWRVQVKSYYPLCGLRLEALKIGR